jgi:hypothetical protein
LTLWAVIFAAAAGIAAFFAWANRQTAKAHARFTARDVEIALTELLDPEARPMTPGICFSHGLSTTRTSSSFARSA